MVPRAGLDAVAKTKIPFPYRESKSVVQQEQCHYTSLATLAPNNSSSSNNNNNNNNKNKKKKKKGKR
jgi:hypothetical protein